VDLSSGDTRRNLVIVGADLPALLGRWFAVGDALLFGMKRCPPCAQLERLTGARLVKVLLRSGIIAAVFAGAEVAEGGRRPAGRLRRGGGPPRGASRCRSSRPRRV
jgi:MOSC domain-containing protein YiiM